MNRKPNPGVERSERLSDEGLARLEAQLKDGIRIAQPVLQQWVKRYGRKAAELIEKYTR